MINKPLRASLVALSLIGLLPHAATGQALSGGHGMDAVTVIDGDTIRVGDIRVRLWGIDAPERDEISGQLAAAFLHGLIFERVVVCRPRGTDRYGRTVAMCFVGSVDIAGALVRAGYARDWPRYSGGYYAR